MSAPIRFGIWCAVSTIGQADEGKDSLPEQERRCRAIAQARGWVEVVDPYIVTESRTRWVSIQTAAQAIPSLQRLILDVSARRVDVICCWDHNRFRDLLDQVAKILEANRCQLFSVNQPSEILPPEDFQPYSSDSGSILRGMSQVISRWQINDLRRKYAYGMVGRIRRGLHPGHVPFGYTGEGAGRDSRLAIDKVQAAIVVQIKDWYLAGRTLSQIAHDLDTRKVPPPAGRRPGLRWYPSTIHRMLLNPVYSGTVRFGRRRSTQDPLTGKRQELPSEPSKMAVGDAIHAPLWDKATARRLADELRHRHRRNKGKHCYRLSNLLVCQEHNRPLRLKFRNNIYYDDAHLQWFCPGQPGHWHVMVRDAELLDAVSSRIVEDVKSIGEKVVLPPEVDRRGEWSQLRAELMSRRSRLTEALELGALDARTYQERIEDLDPQIADLDMRLEQAADEGARRSQLLTAMQSVVGIMEQAPGYVVEGDPQEVNALLRTFIERIVVGEGSLEIAYR